MQILFRPLWMNKRIDWLIDDGGGQVWMNRQTDRQIGRQTDRHTHIWLEPNGRIARPFFTLTFRTYSSERPLGLDILPICKVTQEAAAMGLTRCCCCCCCWCNPLIPFPVINIPNWWSQSFQIVVRAARKFVLIKRTIRVSSNNTQLILQAVDDIFNQDQFQFLHSI